jgi:hypothetical protein
MRASHPGWGPDTIRTELEGDEALAKLKLPSRSRIAAFLKAQNLTRKYERHSDLPQPQRAHEEWEVDAQGVMAVAGLGAVSIINIADLFSRLKIDSLPGLKRSHPNTQAYQLVRRRAFVHYYYGLGFMVKQLDESHGEMIALLETLPTSRFGQIQLIGLD